MITDNYLNNHISGEVKKSRRLLKALSEDTVGDYEPYQINSNLQHSNQFPFTPSANENFYEFLTIPADALQGNYTLSKRDDSIYLHNGNAHRSIQRIHDLLTNLTVNLTFYKNKEAKVQRPFILT